MLANGFNSGLNQLRSDWLKNIIRSFTNCSRRESGRERCAPHNGFRGTIRSVFCQKTLRRAYASVNRKNSNDEQGKERYESRSYRQSHGAGYSAHGLRVARPPLDLALAWNSTRNLSELTELRSFSKLARSGPSYVVRPVKCPLKESLQVLQVAKTSLASDRLISSDFSDKRRISSTARTLRCRFSQHPTRSDFQEKLR